jgi:ribonuclease HI
VGELWVHKSIPSGFFNGDWQSISNVISASGVLYLLESHSIHFKACLCLCSNNYAKFQALNLLLKCAKNWAISRLQVYGDSLLVINWKKISKYSIRYQ